MALGSNKQDIREKMKQTLDRRPRKLRIDRVSKLAIVCVRRVIPKNRSEVIGALKETIKKPDQPSEYHAQIIEWCYAKTQRSKDPCNFLQIAGYFCSDSH
jgi:hypothetical protein